MVQGFNKAETAFTDTALYLATTVNVTTIDFNKWGNPERQKINEVCDVLNLLQWRRRGVI